MELKEQIEKYIPYNEQEENDKKIILDYMNKFDNLLTRENEVAHFTASAWTVNKERTKVLMIYHKIDKVLKISKVHIVASIKKVEKEN